MNATTNEPHQANRPRRTALTAWCSPPPSSRHTKQGMPADRPNPTVPRRPPHPTPTPPRTDRNDSKGPAPGHILAAEQPPPAAWRNFSPRSHKAATPIRQGRIWSAMTPTEFRNLHCWKLARNAVLKYASHCAICGYELRFDAPPRSKWAPSVDHVTPLSRLPLDTAGGRAAALDPDNLRAVHVGCNGRRGNGARRRVELAPARFCSRVW